MVICSLRSQMLFYLESRALFARAPAPRFAPSESVLKSRALPARAPAPRVPRPSSVDLSHHDVDARVDGDDVREQMSFHHLRDRGEIHEGWGANAPAHRLRRAVRDHVVALLTLWTLDGHVAFADRRTRALHHLLEVMDHRLHVA